MCPLIQRFHYTYTIDCPCESKNFHSYSSETENKHPRNVFGRDSDSDEELRESAPEKRLRLAKEYLTRLETAGSYN